MARGRAISLRINRPAPPIRANGLKADTKETDPAGFDRGLPAGYRPHFPAGHDRALLVFAGDLHRPIGAMGGRASGAGDADARGIVEQEIPSVLARVNPLAEGLFEAVIAVGNVFRGVSGPRRCDPQTE